MTTSITYPNGQSLTSTALTQQQVEQIMATLTCGMLGVNPPDYSQVRMSWPSIGQPFQNQPQNVPGTQGVPVNVTYVAATTWATPYALVRDLTYTAPTAPATGVQEDWGYNRGWRVAWVFYGPNASENARAVWTAVTFLEWAAASLAASNLYAVTDPEEPSYAPENINGQWFPRADFALHLYECVAEGIVDGAATSVEIQTYTNAGLVADQTIVK